MKSTVRLCLMLCLTAIFSVLFTLPAAADVVAEPWEYLFTPAGAILSGLLIAAVILVTVLLIRVFFGNKKK